MPIKKYYTGYEIHKYVLLDDFFVGIRCKNYLFIPVENISKKVLSEKFSINIKEDMIELINNQNEIDKINNLYTTIQLYSNLYEESMKININILLFING